MLNPSCKAEIAEKVSFTKKRPNKHLEISPKSPFLDEKITTAFLGTDSAIATCQYGVFTSGG
jgi:hypothetical protein